MLNQGPRKDTVKTINSFQYIHTGTCTGMKIVYLNLQKKLIIQVYQCCIHEHT